MKNGLMNRIKGLFAELTGKSRFERLDFVLLKTTLMLAAVDGEITKEELSLYRELAEKFREGDAADFDALWAESVKGMAYIGFLSEMLEPEELVREFVREVGKDLGAGGIAALERMAAADGDYSKIERDCVRALKERII